MINSHNIRELSLKNHKHQWRKVGGTYDSSSGQMVETKKKCIICGKRK